MKKILLLIILSLYTFNFSLSQEWFPVGAKWHYNWRYNLPFPPGSIYYPEVVEVMKDTVVLGRTCKKIVSKPTQYGAFSQEVSYVFDSLGKVFYYPPLSLNSQYLFVEDKWSILYDFNKTIGDTIFYNIKEIRNNGVDTFTYYNVIDTAYVVPIGGDSLKAYNSTPSTDFWPFQLYFATNAVEVIGHFNPLVLEGHWSYASFTINPSGFRCYEDTSIGFYRNPTWNYNCDSVWSRETSLELKIEEGIRIYPIPANEQLILEVFNKKLINLNLKIFDLKGNLQIQTEVAGDHLTLDVSNLKPGMYIYEIESEGQFLRNKLIIE